MQFSSKGKKMYVQIPQYQWNEMMRKFKKAREWAESKTGDELISYVTDTKWYHKVGWFIWNFNLFAEAGGAVGNCRYRYARDELEKRRLKKKPFKDLEKLVDGTSEWQWWGWKMLSIFYETKKFREYEAAESIVWSKRLAEKKKESAD